MVHFCLKLFYDCVALIFLQEFNFPDGRLFYVLWELMFAIEKGWVFMLGIVIFLRFVEIRFNWNCKSHFQFLFEYMKLKVVKQHADV